MVDPIPDDGSEQVLPPEPPELESSLAEELPSPTVDDIDDSAEYTIPGLEQLGISDAYDEGDPNDPATGDDTGERLNNLETAVEDLQDQITIPLGSLAHIIQTGTGSTWEEVFVVNGTISTSGGTVGVDTLGYTGDTSSGASLISLASNQKVVLEVPDANGSYKRFVTIGGSGGSTASSDGVVSVCYLTQVGGSNGNGTTPASYTYNFYSDSGKTILLGASASQMMPRLNAAEVTAATGGLYTTISGTPTLVYTYEPNPLTTCAADAGFSFAW